MVWLVLLFLLLSLYIGYEGIVGIFKDIPPNLCALERTWQHCEVLEAQWINNISVNPYRYQLMRIVEDDDQYNDGIPVISVHGHRGGYTQIFNFAAQAKKILAESGKSSYRRMNIFTLDMREESSAFHGEIILAQARFVNLCIKEILARYRTQNTVIAIGHSMGGVVLRTAMTLPCYKVGSIQNLFTLNSPHYSPIYKGDKSIEDLYDKVNRFWKNHKSDDEKSVLHSLVWVSIVGGIRDTLVLSDLGDSKPLFPDSQTLFVYSSNIDETIISADHDCIMWCLQFLKPLVRSIYKLITVKKQSVVTRMDLLRSAFVSKTQLKLQLPMSMSSNVFNPVFSVEKNPRKDIHRVVFMLKDSIHFSPKNINNAVFIPVSVSQNEIDEVQIASNIEPGFFQIKFVRLSLAILKKNFFDVFDYLKTNILKDPESVKDIYTNTSNWSYSQCIDLSEYIVTLPEYPISLSSRVGFDSHLESPIYIPNKWPRSLARISIRNLYEILSAKHSFMFNNRNNSDDVFDFILVQYDSSKMRSYRNLNMEAVIRESWIPEIFVQKKRPEADISFFPSYLSNSRLIVSSRIITCLKLKGVEIGKYAFNLKLNKKTSLEPGIVPMIYYYSAFSGESSWLYNDTSYVIKPFPAHFKTISHEPDSFYILILADPSVEYEFSASINIKGTWVLYIRHHLVAIASSLLSLTLLGFYFQITSYSSIFKNCERNQLLSLSKTFVNSWRIVVLFCICVPFVIVFFNSIQNAFSEYPPIIYSSEEKLNEILLSVAYFFISLSFVFVLDSVVSLLVIALSYLFKILNFPYSKWFINATSLPVKLKMKDDGKDDRVSKLHVVSGNISSEIVYVISAPTLFSIPTRPITFRVLLISFIFIPFIVIGRLCFQIFNFIRNLSLDMNENKLTMAFLSSIFLRIFSVFLFGFVFYAWIIQPYLGLLVSNIFLLFRCIYLSSYYIESKPEITLYRTIFLIYLELLLSRIPTISLFFRFGHLNWHIPSYEWINIFDSIALLLMIYTTTFPEFIAENFRLSPFVDIIRVTCFVLSLCIATFTRELTYLQNYFLFIWALILVLRFRYNTY